MCCLSWPGPSCKWDSKSQEFLIPHIVLTKEINYITVFFQSLTSFCPICSHIFKTLNAINTTSVDCNHTINTIHVDFIQYSVNQHVSKMLKCSFHTSLTHTKIMDLSYIFYKCLNTACQKWRPNVPNVIYSVKLLLLQQQQLKSIEKISLYKIL